MKTKICPICKKEFSPYIVQTKFCSKECLKHSQNQRVKLWVENNRERHNSAVRKYRAKRYKEEGRWYDHSPKAANLKKWMIELKSNPCHDCGETFDVCCMDFDHKEGEKKEYNVGTMFAHHYSRELIETEVKKCELVCANCHRIRTQKRRTGSGQYR